jgi:RNA polymerase sigma-70 factor (ECF subfamily)
MVDLGAADLPPISQLYRRHRAKALAIARRIVGDSDDAEDVVQDVFIRLCGSGDGGCFEGKAAYTTWLYRVMVNSSINSLRSRRRRERLAPDSEQPLTPEEEAIGSELGRIFRSALAEMSERHQQILWLREMRGMSYPEIAALLRIPEGTVKSALNRGRTQVQGILERLGHAP